ncbi:Tether containing UBX domain for GLUT4 [Podila verticillata]|nr:Tether containing UBX domain for GLUT4 [Podila verticillata]
MASSVTVMLGGPKKQLVKTTPTMILRQVVNTVCEQQGFSEPELYGLKNGRNFMDLSLSIRYANIAPGTELELVKILRNKDATPTNVDVALQLEDGARIIRTFAITTTLWDILLAFEQSSNGSLNLTRRTGTRPSTVKNNMIALGRRLSRGGRQQPTLVYMLPVVVLLEREYSTIEQLKGTTLELGGLTSGSIVLRVLMRYMDAGIDDFLCRIESSPPRPASSHSNVNGASPSNPNRSREPNGTSIQHISFPSPGGGSYQISIPGMTARGGSLDVNNTKREGNIIIPGAGAGSSGNSDGDTPRQTPAQDMNSAMIEVSQEIRQLREQEAQAALTDRVKRLSKAGESSDKDRFSRSIQFADPPVTAIGSSSTAGPSSSTLASTGISAPLTDEPAMDMEADSDTSTDINPHPLPQRSASVPSPQEVVRQIAHRVSQQLREAQLRGEPTLDYHTLIAQEIVKEQNAGILPVSPPGSRHNSVDKAKASTNRAALPPIAPTTNGQDSGVNVPKESPLTSLSGLESDTTPKLSNKDKGMGKEKDKDRSYILGRQRSLPMLMRRLSGRARADKTMPEANETGATASSGGSIGSGGRGGRFPKWMKLSKK